MSRQRFYSQPYKDKLLHSIPVEDFVGLEFGQSNSPFIQPGSLKKIYALLIRGLSKCMCFLVGRDLYVENTSRELQLYSLPTRRLLNTLKSKKVIDTWECGLQAVDKPAVISCSIQMTEVRSGQGEFIVPRRGLQGYGSGLTFDAALKIALAESLERLAMTQWSSDVFVSSSINDLKRDRVSYFARQYIPGSKEIDNDGPINWVRARDLLKNSDVLIPASVAYLYYSQRYPKEPVFLHTTSNGCAAHIDLGKATLSALYELFERDGFLMYWLNKLSPRQIDLDTIDDPFVQDVIKKLSEMNISLYLCDCKTEFGVPVLVAVLIDEVTHGVDVNSAAGFDISGITRKVMRDVMRWGVGDSRPTWPLSDNSKPSKLFSIQDRKKMWYGGAMRSHIEFFLQGPKISFKDYREQYPLSEMYETLSDKQLLQTVLDSLRKENADAYLFEFSNAHAQDAGLRVVRAIVPQLVPIYFIENEPHLAVDRIFTFAQKMGYADNAVVLEDLNTTPHPFL